MNALDLKRIMRSAMFVMFFQFTLLGTPHAQVFENTYCFTEGIVADVCSGDRQTTVLLYNPFLLKLRENTPFTSEKKRVIRAFAP